MKKFYIENLGCAKNQVDAEVMLESLTESGHWIYSETAEEADLILVNTCGFIEPARIESIDTIFELREAYPEKKIVMTGCLSERYATEISEEFSEVDGFFGNRDLGKITEVADRIEAGEHVVSLPDYPDISGREYMHRDKLLNFAGSAYVKLSEGCDHRCRYCAIPLIRGGLRSRTREQVLDEVKELVDKGVYEINLIAQDLAAFGKDRGAPEFMELLDEMSLLPGKFIIRMLYIHPDDFPAELPALVKERERIIPYFDIPFQHAAVPVLRKMGRTGSAESYLKLLESIRQELPDAVIRSTFLLGFVNEDEQARQELLDFIASAQLDWVGSFIYSLEEGTPAFTDRDESTHEEVIAEAEAFKPRLEELQERITNERLERWVGREFDVLIEEVIPHEDLLIGRIPMQAPEVDGLTVVLSETGEPGDLIRCRITRTVGIDLEAVPVQGA